MVTSGEISMAAQLVLLDCSETDETGLGAYLAAHGLRMTIWPASEPSVRRLAARPADLVLIHRRAAQDPELTLLRRIRDCSAIPVVLRAVDTNNEAERIRALERGADDYLPATMSQREILARLRCVLRRAPSAQAMPTGVEPGWRLCARSRTLFAPDGSPCHLTSAEFGVLLLLYQQQGVPVAREALSLTVLRRPYHPEDRALDNLVLRLRRKLGDEGPYARIIKSIRGVGYIFLGFSGNETAAPARAVATAMPPHRGTGC
jgi:DNA-binding response OmpR family regulator